VEEETAARLQGKAAAVVADALNLAIDASLELHAGAGEGAWRQGRALEGRLDGPRRRSDCRAGNLKGSVGRCLVLVARLVTSLHEKRVVSFAQARVRLAGGGRERREVLLDRVESERVHEVGGRGRVVRPAPREGGAAGWDSSNGSAGDDRIRLSDVLGRDPKDDRCRRRVRVQVARDGRGDVGAPKGCFVGETRIRRWTKIRDTTAGTETTSGASDRIF